MPLKIDFENADGEIHIIITDGCQVQLDPEDRRLSPLQRTCAQQLGLRRFLLYENIYFTPEFRFYDKRSFNVFCPTYNTEYLITKEDYELALEEFCEEYRIKWELPEK